jgi:hypothetical protein
MLNTLHTVVPIFKDTNTVYYGNAYMIESGLIYSGRFSHYKLAYKNICHQAIFYPRSLFEKYKFDQSYKVHADYHLNLLSFNDRQFKYVFINRIISTYGESGFSTKNIDTFYAKERFLILKRNYAYSVYIYACLRYWLALRFKKFLPNRK